MLFKKLQKKPCQKNLTMDFNKKFEIKFSGHKIKHFNQSSDINVKKRKQQFQSPANTSSRGFSYKKSVNGQIKVEDLKMRSLNTDRIMMMKRRNFNRFFQTQIKQGKSHFDKCTIKVIDNDNEDEKFMSISQGCKLSNGDKFLRYQVDKIGTFTDFLYKKSHRRASNFSFVPSNITMDYCLTQPEMDGSFLNGNQISLTPLYYIPQKKITLNSFEIIKCIGTGGFAKVYLCRFLENLNFYAMKIVQKEDIVKKKKQHIIQNQLQVMKKIRGHPFIIDIKFAFETDNYIVFITEFCPGSQFFNVIKKFKRMNEQHAKFYAIQILLGLDHIHQNQVLYRDIKPENILLDIDGHVKITDFGLSKPVKKQNKWRAFSFCGSPEYMSPQIILKTGHTYTSDFYSFGALLYEMLTGLPPFYSQDSKKIFQGTLSESIQFPKGLNLSQQVKNLMKALLDKNESTRLGSYMGIKQILAHPWFGKINRSYYINKAITPPVTFNSADKIDLNFKQYQCENDKIDQFKGETEGSSKKFKNFIFDFREEHFDQFPIQSNGVISNNSEDIEKNKENRRILPFNRMNITSDRSIDDKLITQIKKAFLPRNKTSVMPLSCKRGNNDRKLFS